MSSTGSPEPRAAAQRGGGRRVGVLGGTFDPPHIGHLVTAINVGQLLSLDLVLMVVANEPWQKVGSRTITPAVDRLAMVEAAVSDEPGIEASDLEIRRGGSSYSVDTLRDLRASEPDADHFLILGSDTAAELHTWERSEELAKLCHIVVVERPGVTTEVAEGFTFDRVRVPRLEVSSTDLRERARDGRPLKYLVPDAVISLIERGGLYGEPR